MPEQSTVSRQHSWLLPSLWTMVIIAAVFLLPQVTFSLLLIFAGLLFAVFLDSFTRLLMYWTGLPRWAGWIAAMALLLGSIALLVIVISPHLNHQVPRLAEQMPEAWRELRAWMADFAWMQSLLPSRTPQPANWLASGTDLFGQITGVVSVVLGGVANFIIILFIGIYLSLAPRLYRDGALQLTHPDRREHLRDVGSHIGATLRNWIIGRLITMVVVSLLTWLGLKFLLGMPLALSLAIIAGLLSFVPYLGALVSALPAMLVAFPHDAKMSLYVALLYLGVNLVEGYVITPMVQLRTVHIAPAFLIIAQLLGGVIAGPIGVVLAAPLGLAGLLLLRELYLEPAWNAVS